MVNWKPTDPAPAALAVTTYAPGVSSAVALTEAEAGSEAVPPVMTAVAAESVAEAAVVGAAKLTRPPSTGSIELLAVTVTARDLVNIAPSTADWGVLLATGLSLNP